MVLRRSLERIVWCVAFCVTASAMAFAVQNEAPPVNRLAGETSPYLRLHARNPVHWYPWGPEALARSKAENKPIFLSIGYSSCFWCHVMERKVFENPEIAAVMNAHFINIKVDREERPDLDDLYMLALQVYLQATGVADGGGWPLSLFLTPEGKPIAGGTYFPPEDLPGRPGFPNVLKRVHEIWTNDEAKVRGSADVLAREVQRLSGPSPLSVPKAPASDLAPQAIQELLASRDPEFGGFGFDPKAADRPKFPQPSRLLLLSRHTNEPGVAEALDQTLEQMARGGLYDHLAGGFHRYSVDRQWRVPHFEKMLYDNAQLAEVYALAAERTGREDFRRVATETLDFLMREMADPHGGFYSAMDAETNGVEGAYYVWSLEELQKVLVNEAPLFAAAYGVDQPTSFEPGHVLYVAKTDAQLAEAFKAPAEEIRNRLASCRLRLLDVRRQRPALLRDDKILAGWNGQMIRALSVSGAALKQPAYLLAAERTALFVLTNMLDSEGILQRSYCNGQTSHRGCLDDSAFLIDGLLSLHEASGDVRWLNASRRLMDRQLKQFWDEKGGGFYYTSHDHEQLLARMKDGYDSVMPSGNSVSLDALVRLARLTGDPQYRSHAEKTLAAFGPQMEQSPSGFARMVLAAEEILKAPPADQVAAAGKSPVVMELAAAPQTARRTAPGAAEELTVFAEPAAAEAAKHEQLKGKIYLSADRLTPGTSVKVAVVIDVANEWHINANPARPDFVIPAELEMEALEGIELTDMIYPAGKDLAMKDLPEPVSVYEGKVTLVGTLKVSKDLKAGPQELKFSLRYQACNHEKCLIPKRLKVNGSIPVGPDAKPLNGSLFNSVKAAPAADKKADN